MKTITSLFLILALAVFSSCEGPTGPAGLDGENGKDGTSLLGSVFQVDGSFTTANKFTLFSAFPSNLKVNDTDIVMVYIRWDQVEEGGEILNLWRALPQTAIMEDGLIQYNFDYTMASVEIFLTATVNELSSEWTDNQVFRVAVLPAEVVLNKSIDINSLNSVMKSLEVNPNTIKKISLTK